MTQLKALFDVKDASTAELFSTYRRILAELRKRAVVRSENAPTGDYAEYLVQRWSGGTMADVSEKSWDVEADGRRLQVKSRLVGDSTDRGKRQLSPFRPTSEDDWGFDQAAIVLFDEDYGVKKAALLTWQQVRDAAVYKKHVNGWVLMATDSVLAQGTDITEELRRAGAED